MSAAGIVLHVDGFALSRADGDAEFRVRDIDLAERLGYDQPRMIRKLIARMVETGEIAAPHVRSAVERTSMPRGGQRAVKVDEYWLDEIEALLVVMHSDAPNAVPMRRTIAEVFRRALRDFEAQQLALTGPLARIAQWMLAPKAQAFEAMWPDSLVREIERLHGREWAGGAELLQNELARRLLAERERRDRYFAAARAQAELRAFGFSVWLGIGGGT